MSNINYFISDLHLGLGDKEEENRKELLLIKFLEFITHDAGRLFILGDLFDYWFEYKRVIQKEFFRTHAALRNLSDNNIELHYIIGNHDFLHRDFFQKEIGANLYFNPLDIELSGKRFYLAHGDGLMKKDAGYKILKKILRNSFLQKLYSAIHPDLGIKIASSTSKTSRSYTENKNYGESDSLFEIAKGKIDSGFDYVMFGHSHIQTKNEYNKGYYINLGSWLENPCYGKFDGEHFEIIDWVPNGK